MSEVLRDWDLRRGPRVGLGVSVGGDVDGSVKASVQAASNVLPMYVGDEQVSDASRHALRRNVLVRDLRSPVQFVADLLFIVGLGAAVCVALSLFGVHTLVNISTNLSNSLAIGAVTLIMERAINASSSLGFTTRMSRFQQALRSWTYGIGGFLFILFACQASANLSRAYLVALYVAGLGGFGIWRGMAAPVIARLNKRLGSTASHFVVLGDTSRSSVQEFADGLDDSECSASVIAFNAGCSDADWTREVPRVITDMRRVLHGVDSSAIYICSTGLSVARQDVLVRAMAVFPFGTYVVPDPKLARLARHHAIMVGPHVAFELRKPPLGRLQMFGKRLIDLVLGSVALVVFSPIMIGAALAIWLDSSGPVFFRQSRTGQNGVPFKIFKFRSMHVMEDGPNIQQASRNDPRVTRVGRFLRASSIDELPQLFNVLAGDMSLVGPRPHAVAHDVLYAKEIDHYELRQHAKPGITGWAQVNGLRGETADIELMHRRIEYDIWYAQNASLLLDLEILARTALVICWPRNVY